MIYTITFSPSIDYVINSEKEFNQNDLNRVENYDFFPGGKGINASIILKRIGFENKPITFLGGSTKKLFSESIKNEKLDIVEFKANNKTRINVKMFAPNASFEINGQRAVVEKEEFENFLAFINNKITKDDFVFVMGLTEEKMIDKILKIFKEKSIQFALDIDSPKLIKWITYKPFIIKPNKKELEAIMQVKMMSEDCIMDSMLKLQKIGSKNVLVSDGKNGSYFLSENKNIYKINILKDFNIVSTVGAGDTLLSTFTILFRETKDVEESLIKATSLSIGTSCSKFLGKKTDINKYKDFIEVKKIN